MKRNEQLRSEVNLRREGMTQTINVVGYNFRYVSSFLLSPFVLLKESINSIYFGNEAIAE